MKGWFDAVNKTIGFITIEEVTCELQMLQLWDAHPQGRFGCITQAAPKCARPLLNTHFALLDHKRVMWNETRYMSGCLPENPPPAPSCSGKPVILLSRFMDNVYVAFCGIPPALFEACATFVRLFLDTLYQIPMKWEPHGPMNGWCECRVVTHPEPALLMKGVTFQPRCSQPVA